MRDNPAYQVESKTIERGGRVALLKLVLELTSVRNLGHVTKFWCIRYVYQCEISSETKKKYWNKRRYIKTQLQRYLTDSYNILTYQFIDASSEFLWKIHWNSRKWGKGVFYFGYEQLVYISLFLPSWIFNRRFVSNYTLLPLSQNYNQIIVSKCISANIGVISAHFSKRLNAYDASESHSSLPFDSPSKKPIPTTVSWTEGIFVCNS